MERIERKFRVKYQDVTTGEWNSVGIVRGTDAADAIARAERINSVNARRWKADDLGFAQAA